MKPIYIYLSHIYITDVNARETGGLVEAWTCLASTTRVAIDSMFKAAAVSTTTNDEWYSFESLSSLWDFVQMMTKSNFFKLLGDEADGWRVRGAVGV